MNDVYPGESRYISEVFCSQKHVSAAGRAGTYVPRNALVKECRI